MCISMDRDNLLLESDPGSHHVGVQADTVRPATNQPYSFPSQFPIKPVPSIALFQQLPTRQSSTYSLTTTTTTFTTTTKMCKHEIIGDFYRGCRHFHGRYFTGEILDCGSEVCKTSRKHKHKSPNCGCTPVMMEERKIQNMFQFPFPQCHRVSR